MGLISNSLLNNFFELTLFGGIINKNFTRTLSNVYLKKLSLDYLNMEKDSEFKINTQKLTHFTIDFKNHS